MGKIIFVLLFTVFQFSFQFLTAQKVDSAKFFKKFNASSDLDKVFIFDSLPDKDKFRLYPALDSIFNLIKQKAMQENNSLIYHKIDFFDALYNNSIYKYQTSIKTLTNILKQPDGLNFNDSVRIFYLLKTSYLKTKNVMLALEAQRQLETLKEKDKTLPFWVLSPSLSQMYLDIGLYDEAINQLKLEYKTYPIDFSNDQDWASYYNNLGVYYSRANKSDSAIVNFISSKKRIQNKLQKDPKNVDLLFFDGLIDGNIGQALKNKNEFAAAIPLLKKDIYYSLLSENNINAAISLNELGECYFLTNEYSLAAEKLDSAATILNATDDVKHKLQNIKLKAKLFALNNNYKKASEYFESYIKINDSIGFEERSIQLIFQQESFKKIQNEKKISEQQLQMIGEQNSLKSQSEYKSIFLTAFLVSLAMLVYFYFHSKTSNKQKVLLEIKNNAIENHKLLLEKSLKDKEILFKEIHHRVKNNMQVVSSLLTLQINKVENATAKHILQDGRSRIDSISLIHKYLYENVDINKIKIDEYLSTLIEQIKSVVENSNQTKIKIELAIDKVNFDLDTTIPIGLIVNELVSNSYKYAFPKNEGTIQLEIKKQHLNKFELLVSDNGIGLPVDYRTKKNESLGLELVDMLADQIDATVEIENTNGVHFKFTFFYPRYKKPENTIN